MTTKATPGELDAIGRMLYELDCEESGITPHWPSDASKQPYCQSYLRQAQRLLERGLLLTKGQADQMVKDAVHAHLQHQVDIVNRSGMMPKADHDAAIAAAYEAAAQHMPLFESQGRRLAACQCGWKVSHESNQHPIGQWQTHIISLAKPEQRDALAQVKVQRDSEWTQAANQIMEPREPFAVAKFAVQPSYIFMELKTQRDAAFHRLEQEKAQAVSDALDRLWELLEENTPPFYPSQVQQAIAKVKEEGGITSP